MELNQLWQFSTMIYRSLFMISVIDLLFLFWFFWLAFCWSHIHNIVFYLVINSFIFCNAGGWNNPNFKDWFGDYARILFSLFGDRVKTWFTINEPLVFCYAVSPLIKQEQEFDSKLCAKNMLLAHAEAWRIYDKEFRNTQNGKLKFCCSVIST